MTDETIKLLPTLYKLAADSRGRRNHLKFLVVDKLQNHPDFPPELIKPCNPLPPPIRERYSRQLRYGYITLLLDLNNQLLTSDFNITQDQITQINCLALPVINAVIAEYRGTNRYAGLFL
jgi:hypothetical protein